MNSRTHNQLSNRRLIVIILAILSALDIILLYNGGSFVSAGEVAEGAPLNQRPFITEANGDINTAASATIRIRPSASAIEALSAAGAVELISKRQIVLEVDSAVRQVAVKVGDWVEPGQLLVALDETELKRAVERAELDLTTAQADLAKLQRGSDAGEIAVAEANLVAAQENLAKVSAGPSAAEIAAAKAKINAAGAKYGELTAPPSSAELDEAKAEMEKADIARQEAQRAYDQIKWRNDIGMTPEAAALYKATVEYERVVAKFNRANQPSAQSSLADAASDIQKAKSELALLLQKPNPAEIAEAQAKVKDAEQRLAKLKAGPATADLQGAEAKMQKAQLDLDDAQTKLQRTQIVAPQAGAILELNVSPGERGTIGKVVAVIADVHQLKLTVKVAEVDVTRVATGQPVTIALDAIRDHTFNGIVEQIDPINRSDSKDVVNYPVTIRLTDASLEGVRPGMNAVATFADGEIKENRWLVPTTALHEQNGQTVVQVVHGENITATVVNPIETQGEWTVVESPGLHNGDEVMGKVASYVDQQQDIKVSY